MHPRTLPLIFACLGLSALGPSCAVITEHQPFLLLGDDDDSGDDDTGDDDTGDDDTGDDDTGDDDSGDDDTTPPVSDCDTSWLEVSKKTVSFSTTLVPLFLELCQDCHTVQGHGELFLTPAQAYDQLVGVVNMLGYDDLLRVAPGDAEGSYLMHKIVGCGRDDPVWGYHQAPMPPKLPNLVPLEQEQINQVYSWILQGAEDN